MQEGRFSTIRFNEWICVSAQYEKAVARLGRQVYQGFSRGLLDDFPSLELCREISETFAEARTVREELEEELERDVLDGLSVEETKIADEHRKLTQTQKTTRTLKLRFVQLLGRHSINRRLAAHRDRVRELSRDLGLRALACHKDNPILKVKGHRALCRLADQLNDDADKKWQEIVASNKEGGGGLSFHTLLLNFIGNFANFSKGTPVGKMLLKYFRYDESAENSKLKKAYEGSAAADTLRAQLDEIEEPHLDIGREIDNMQQEYEETPLEWNMPSSGKTSKPSPSNSFGSSDSSTKAPSAEVESWKPQADDWTSDFSADDDFLNVASETSAHPPSAHQASTPPTSSGPQLLRRRPEPEAESWGETSALPTPSKNTPPTPPKPSASENWGWGNTSDEDSWSAPAPTTPSVKRAGDSLSLSEEDIDPFDFGFDDEVFPPSNSSASESMGLESPHINNPSPEALMPEESLSAPKSREIPEEAPQAPPTTSRPPFVKAQKMERPLGDWSAEPTPASSEAPEPDYGWGTAPPPAPAQPQRPHPSPNPPFTSAPASKPMEAIAPPEPDDNDEVDPLLKLLRPGTDIASPIETHMISDDDPEDDLLPAFLKERVAEEEASEDDTFIPELPSFLSAEGPQLEIVPFGSKDGYPSVGNDDDEEKPFIPQMPDL